MIGPAARAALVIEGRIAAAPGAGGPGWVEAIAIAEGRVIAAGTRQAIALLDGPRTRRWRIGHERVVLPGIVDAHLHLVDAALAAERLTLDGIRGRTATLAAIGAAHEERVAAGDTDGWMLGKGWSLDRFGGAPEAALLDAVATGRPVALWSADHHSRWVSSAAMRRAGIGTDTADPPGGVVVRGPDGHPTGLLLEDAATLVDHAIPEPDAGLVAAAIARYAGYLARLGVTGVQDPGEVGADPELRRGPTLVRALARDGRLPLRVTASVREDQLAAAIALGVRTGRPADAADATDPIARRLAARARDGWLKLFADGALGSRTAALLAPYEPGDPAGPPPAGAHGLLLRDARALGSCAARAAAAGIAVQVHAIGDAAVRRALDLLAVTPRAGQAAHRIEHAQLIDPADQPRLGALGIVASVQPCHLPNDAVPARAAWGARTAAAFPLASIAAGGAVLAFGTDAPVEPPDPWPGIAVAIDRIADRDRGSAFHPEQAIDRWLALGAATGGPARSLGVAGEGTLLPGSAADLIVVPAAVADGDPGDLAACRPVATLIDGVPAWLAPDADYP